MGQMTGNDGGLGRGFANWDAAASAVVGANKNRHGDCNILQPRIFLQTKNIISTFFERIYSRFLPNIYPGGWYTYPSEKWWSSSMGFGSHPVYMNSGKIIQSCLKPPTSVKIWNHDILKWMEWSSIFWDTPICVIILQGLCVQASKKVDPWQSFWIIDILTKSQACFGAVNLTVYLSNHKHIGFSIWIILL